jgi:hypothetical protein
MYATMAPSTVSRTTYITQKITLLLKQTQQEEEHFYLIISRLAPRFGRQGSKRCLHGGRQHLGVPDDRHL